MNLYNIVLGNLQLTPEPWSHVTDDHGNHFIAKDDIRQRIRIDGKVDEKTFPELGELTPVWSAANMQCYDILPGTKWVNNNRNMNPLLINNKDVSEDNNQIVIYITVSNNYAITRFRTSHRILQTYHKKDMYQGCAIVLNTSDRELDNRVISINVYDKKKDQYSQFNISFTKDDLNKLNIERRAVTNKAALDVMKNQTSKYNNRYMGFKIITKPEELITLAYVTSDKFMDEIVNLTKSKNINNPLIIGINPDDLKDSNTLESLTAMLQDTFTTGRIRAITQCGVDLPLDVIRQLKLLYVFNYDVKHNVLSCRKSN